MKLEKRDPDDMIYDTKRFINELSIVQNLYFDTLVNELDFSAKGEEWLFDYVFNDGEERTFEEYLEAYGKTLEEMTKK